MTTATPPLGLTDAQREARREGLGASEIAAVCGLGEFGETPFTVWARKTGLAPEFEGNRFTEWGNRLEPALRQAYYDSLPDRERVRVLPGPQRPLRRPDDPWMLCSPDGLVMATEASELPTDADRGVELKSRINLWDVSAWGEEGSDQVPDATALQCHWSMLVTGLRRWDVAALLPGCDFRVYSLAFDEEIAQEVQRRGHHFWHAHVLGKTAPAAVAKDNEHLNRLLTQRSREMVDAHSVPLPIAEDTAQLAQLKEQAKTLETEIAGLEAPLKQFIGERGGYFVPGFKVTWNRDRPSLVTDWESVARDMALDLALREVDPKPYITRHTTERQGKRPFLLRRVEEAR